MNSTIRDSYPLPAPHNAETNALDLTPKAVEHWLESLPVGSPEPLAERLCDTLYEVNRREVAADVRLAFIHQVEIRLQYVFNTLHKKLQEVSTPARKQELERAELLGLLHEEMALAYRSGIDDTPSASASADTATLLYKALFHLCQCVKVSYVMKAATRDAIWRKIYALYQFARKKSIDGTAVNEPTEAQRNTVENIFKTTLLLSLIAPQSLRGDELTAFCSTLPELAEFTFLSPASDLDFAGTAYLIDLNGTTAPSSKPLSTAPPQNNLSGKLLFDVSPLTKELWERLADVRDGKVKPVNPSGYEPGLIKKLISRLSAERKRRAKRIDGELDVEVLAGLKEIHHFLLGDREPEPLEDGSPIDLDNAPSSGSNISYNILLNLEKVTIENPFAELKGKKPPTTIHASKVEARHSHCKTVNFSSSGYCLKTDVKEEFRLHLGEFVIVRESGGGRWLPGNVSWLSTTRSKLLFGIKLLAPQFGAGRLLSGHDPANGFEECLFLLDMDGSHRLRLLVCPQPLKVGSAVSVELGDRVLDLVLTRKLSRTTGYIEFECGNVSVHVDRDEQVLDDTDVLELDDGRKTADTDSKTLRA